MYSDHLARELAFERQKSRLAEAAAAGLVKQARLARRRKKDAVSGPTPGRSTYDPRRVQLRDGSEIVLRQVTRSDADLLASGFEQLSVESRRSRFHIGKNALTPAELRYLTDVDHHDHEALGAVSSADGRGVGVSRYVRSAVDPRAAEVAVAVVDEWQGRGVGTELIARLADRARREGIDRFTALVSPNNTAVIRMLRSTALEVELVDCDDDSWEYEIRLVPSGDSPGRHRSLVCEGA